MNIGALKDWFLEEKRDFPWRENPSAYAVWISEVMLQQTLASVVVRYFQRWMQKFPTLESLATASLEDVIKAWEGLGYYSRARNLHEAAQLMVKKFGGKVPSDRETLEKIKGFGPYTVGAVLSFAFHKKAAAVDGNVVRVIARFFNIWEDISKKKIFNNKVETLLPEEEPWVVMEALIELGSQICQKKPRCDLCPIQENCLGYQAGVASLLPIKQKRVKITYLKRDVAVIVNNNKLLIKKVKVGKVMGGLCEFPYVTKGGCWDFDLSLEKIKDLSRVTHGFTRFSVDLYPAIYRAKQTKDVEGYDWLTLEEIEKSAFSSGHRRILKEVLSEDFIH